MKLGSERKKTCIAYNKGRTCSILLELILIQRGCRREKQYQTPKGFSFSSVRKKQVSIKPDISQRFQLLYSKRRISLSFHLLKGVCLFLFFFLAKTGRSFSIWHQICSPIKLAFGVSYQYVLGNYHTDAASIRNVRIPSVSRKERIA